VKQRFAATGREERCAAVKRPTFAIGSLRQAARYGGRVKESRGVPITVPELGSPRATFSLWHVQVGDRVTEGDRVAEVLIPGAVFDVAAPATGVLATRTVQPGDALAAGQVLGEIEEAEQPA
jgi:biotin carboxyl carrier protein